MEDWRIFENCLVGPSRSATQLLSPNGQV